MGNNVNDTAGVSYGGFVRKYAHSNYKFLAEDVNSAFAETFTRANPADKAQIFRECSPAAQEALVVKLNAFVSEYHTSDANKSELAVRAANGLSITGGLTLTITFTHVFVKGMNDGERSAMIRTFSDDMKKKLTDWLTGDYMNYYLFYPERSDAKEPDPFSRGIESVLKLKSDKVSLTQTQYKHDHILKVVKKIEYTPLGGGPVETKADSVFYSGDLPKQ